MPKLVIYEPCRQGTKEGFLQCLKSLGCTAQLTCNCWLIQSCQNCVTLRNTLCQRICPGDRLFVVACKSEAAWVGDFLSSPECIKDVLNCN
ncbi:MAG TPA: hypothetical protein PLH38_01190 [Clostridia bacterium]|nr:hypothetical protein [Clostridia bacterium]